MIVSWSPLTVNTCVELGVFNVVYSNQFINSFNECLSATCVAEATKTPMIVSRSPLTVNTNIELRVFNVVYSYPIKQS